MKIRVQLTRFAVIGVLNTLLHLAVVGVLIQSFGTRQLVANVAAYVVASSFSFVANSFWTFQLRPQARRYGRFQLVGIIGLAVCAALGYLGDLFGWHYAITVFLTACMVPLVSFLAHRIYTYAR